MTPTWRVTGDVSIPFVVEIESDDEPDETAIEEAVADEMATGPAPDVDSGAITVSEITKDE